MNMGKEHAKGNLGSPEVQEEEDWNYEGGNGDEQQPGPSHKNNGNSGAPMKLMGQEGNRAIEVDKSEESQEEMSDSASKIRKCEADYDTPDEQGLGQNGQTIEVEDEMSAIED
ncbi:hypothetical protein FRC11_001522 [Ceratobasidium sp. 423]|nr:hypothetical protein FRC11_001522 [Ceratobasidium sp. 423]